MAELGVGGAHEGDLGDVLPGAFQLLGIPDQPDLPEGSLAELLQFFIAVPQEGGHLHEAQVIPGGGEKIFHQAVKGPLQGGGCTHRLNCEAQAVRGRLRLGQVGQKHRDGLAPAAFQAHLDAAQVGGMLDHLAEALPVLVIEEEDIDVFRGLFALVVGITQQPLQGGVEAAAAPLAVAVEQGVGVLGEDPGELGLRGHQEAALQVQPEDHHDPGQDFLGLKGGGDEFVGPQSQGLSRAGVAETGERGNDGEVAPGGLRPEEGHEPEQAGRFLRQDEEVGQIGGRGRGQIVGCFYFYVVAAPGKDPVKDRNRGLRAGKPDTLRGIHRSPAFFRVFSPERKGLARTISC